MSGRHSNKSAEPRVAPPVPDLASNVALVVPNRERMAYLTHLARRLPPGLSAGFGYRDHEVVMHVVAVGPGWSRTAESGPVAGVTVACRYADGQWWFARGGDDSRFAAANDLREAAHVIVRALHGQLAQQGAST
ncbi:hypothetical protein AB0J52_25365 [Spirillospora sp. NPDC049652]